MTLVFMTASVQVMIFLSTFSELHKNMMDCLSTVLPINAAAIPGECSFDKSMCGWKNDTHISSIKPGQTAGLISRDSLIPHKNAVSSLIPSLGGTKLVPVQWRLATPKNRPANLQDHTFRAPGN